MYKDIKYLVLSDIHGGRSNNPIENISTNLLRFFSTYKRDLVNVDYIFITGDTYDKLLVNGSEESNKTLTMIFFLLNFCVEHNIGIRILKGTPSHDWDQLTSIMTIVENHPTWSKLNIKYVSTLSIEYFPSHDMNLLYVPDEWRTNVNDTYMEVLELLDKHKLSKVDICLMHGFFNYQLPDIVGVGHDEEKYLNLCRYYIHIGHVHTFSTFERIICGGSQDRLAHNEEEDKGAILVWITSEGTMRYKFLINSFALLFKKIKVFSNTSITTIKQTLRKMFKDNYGRVKLIAHDDVQIDIRGLKDYFPNLHIEQTFKRNVVETVVLENISVIDITKENVTALLLEIDPTIKQEVLSNYL